MAKEWFSRKGITFNSEKIDLKTRTMADGKLNNHRILTDLDLPDTLTIVNETFYTALPVQTKTLNATTMTPLTFNTLNTPSVQSGVTQTSPGNYRLTKKGNYKFKVQFAVPVNSRYYVLMLQDGVGFDGESRENTAPVFAGQENALSWIFFFSKVTDTPVVISFSALGQTMDDPTANPTVGHEIIFSMDGSYITPA